MNDFFYKSKNKYSSVHVFGQTKEQKKLWKHKDES